MSEHDKHDECMGCPWLDPKDFHCKLSFKPTIFDMEVCPIDEAKKA